MTTETLSNGQRHSVVIVRQSNGRMKALLGDGVPLVGVMRVVVHADHGQPAEVTITLAGAAVTIREENAA